MSSETASNLHQSSDAAQGEMRGAAAQSGRTECTRAEAFSLHSLVNPLPLLLRWRGDTVESYHCGVVAIADAAGGLQASFGPVEAPVFGRSSLKPIQALVFLETGGAAAYSCNSAEIALAAASHLAQPMHIAALRSWTARLGLQESDLACGPDWPIGPRLPKRGGADAEPPSALENNNAGKHLAVLSTCRFLGEPIAGYHLPGHPAMQRIDAKLDEFCGMAPPGCAVALDNCGMPTKARSVAAIARGMARLAEQQARGAGPAFELCEAIAQAPEFFGGQRRFTSQIVQASGGRVIAKGGSEGVFAALDRRSGLGFALKIADGSGEAASAVLLEVLVAAKSLSPIEAAPLRAKSEAWAHAFAPERSQRLSFPFLTNGLFRKNGALHENVAAQADLQGA